MNPPRILIYTLHHEEFTPVPAGMEYAAAMVPSGPGTHWLSTGATPEEARAKLEALWQRQFPPPSPKRAAALEKAHAARRKSPSASVVSDDEPVL